MRACSWIETDFFLDNKIAYIKTPICETNVHVPRTYETLGGIDVIGG